MKILKRKWMKRTRQSQKFAQKSMNAHPPANQQKAGVGPSSNQSLPPPQGITTYEVGK